MSWSWSVQPFDIDGYIMLEKQSKVISAYLHVRQNRGISGDGCWSNRASSSLRHSAITTFLLASTPTHRRRQAGQHAIGPFGHANQPDSSTLIRASIWWPRNGENLMYIRISQTASFMENVLAGRQVAFRDSCAGVEHGTLPQPGGATAPARRARVPTRRQHAVSTACGCDDTQADGVPSGQAFTSPAPSTGVGIC